MTEGSGVVLLEPGAGRSYDMGQLVAVFKVDEETHGQYSISEWWMQPGFTGVGAHNHEENDEVFYALKGRAEVLAGEAWLPMNEGSFVRIPRTVAHDFRNTSPEEAGLLNLFIPGDFERLMPGIVDWFRQRTR